MAAILTANVAVTEPGSADPVVLLAGDPLPEWAQGLVGVHVVEDDGADDSATDDGDAGSEAPAKTRRRRATDGGSS